MVTRYLSCSDEDLREAAGIIARGGLAAFPTETVYGLGGNALDPEAARRIYAAKGRPSDNPLIVHISDISQVESIAAEFPENAKKLAEAIWPGPMTIVLPKKDIVPDETTGGLKTVAIRFPADEAAQKLISYAGVPIAAPSANLSGRPSPTRWEHVREDLDGRCDAIIMGQPCVGGIESTVVDMTGELPQILRPGLITPQRIEAVLGLPCSYDPAVLAKPSEGLIPKAPGMKYKHYAPKADMTLYRGGRDTVARRMEADAEALRAEGKKTAVLVYGTGREAAERLFADLREKDDEGTDAILAAALDEADPVAFSVMNRMLKSAGYRITEVHDMRIAVASDHGGYELKEIIKKHLLERGFEVLDLGTNSTESVDYPIYGEKCGRAVASGEVERGVVCCGTGIGISIAANKVKGVRAAVVTNDYMAEYCKLHNDANIIAFGGRVISPEDALRFTDIWLDTEFEGGRHQRRVDMLNALG